jgi:nicotinamidase-related amidase
MCRLPIPALTLAVGLAFTLPGAVAGIAPNVLPAAVTPASQAAAQGVALPEIPAPVAVILDAKTTALSVLDLTANACAQPPCSETVIPTVAALVAQARQAGALVVWTLGEGALREGGEGATFRPGLTPAPGEAVVGAPESKFNHTNLDQLLHEAGIDTVILVGVRANGAVMNTALDANRLGYTVVVADDGMFSDDFGMLITRYQVLNHGGPSTRNPTNRPLAPRVTTLSRSDLISFTE